MQELLPQLFKTEYRKIVSVLCKLFGPAHIALAEDIANDSFLLAAETWGKKGIPENPAAWLQVVAKNKTRDYLRRNTLFREKILPSLQQTTSTQEEINLDLSGENIADSQLKMLFVICDPVIPVEAQIGLALRILCGFGIEEIAEAFLTGRDTINKRLQRAREKLRTVNLRLDLPLEAEIDRRLDAVLSVLYLLFNEGYYPTSGRNRKQKELCLEAMRLCYLLVAAPGTNRPPVNALLALMCFHASRFAARSDSEGGSVLYEDQDRDQWDEELIARGHHYLAASASGQEISKYHLEANIAYWHSVKKESPEKWDAILQLYNRLLQIEYSPAAALNRTFALFKVKGKTAAIEEAQKLALPGNHLYFLLLGFLYAGIDDARAAGCYREALALARTDGERATCLRRLQSLEDILRNGEPLSGSQRTEV